jgi:hypothetical protein
MAAPRRRILRPTLPAVPEVQRQRQLQRLRERLVSERAAQARWQTRLKRAFNALEKHQKVLIRLERQLARLEEC